MTKHKLFCTRSKQTNVLLLRLKPDQICSQTVFLNLSAMVDPSVHPQYRGALGLHR